MPSPQDQDYLNYLYRGAYPPPLVSAQSLFNPNADDEPPPPGLNPNYDQTNVPTPPQPDPTNPTASTSQGPSSQLPPLDPQSNNGSGNYSGLKMMGNGAMPSPGAASAQPATPAPPDPNAAAPTVQDLGPGAPNETSEVAPASQLATKPLNTEDQLEKVAQQKLDLTKNAPKNNWAQNLAMAILATTKLAPVASMIVHPKYTMQQSNLGAQQSQLEEQQKQELTQNQSDAAIALKEAQEANVKSLDTDRQLKVKEQGTAAWLKTLGQNTIQYQPGDTLPPGYSVLRNPFDPTQLVARPANVPVPVPAELKALAPGRTTVTPVELDQLYKAYQAERLAGIAAGNKADLAAAKQITPAMRLAAKAVGIDPDNTDNWTPAQAAAVEKALADQAQSTHIHVDNGNVRGDKSYQFHAGLLNKIGTPLDALNQRLGRLQDTLNQNSPQADALVAPELLSVMAGGVGSGVRMNEAEIARIVGGRSAWQSLQAAAQHWNADPASANSITPAQRGQIRALMQTVYQKVQQKQGIINQAQQDLGTTQDPMQHRAIYTRAVQGIQRIDNGGASPAPDISPAVQKALSSVGPGVHTLSDGTKWLKDQAGNITRQ